jgi:DNA repair exonuclease SbcCD ATPase subunit
MEIRIKTQDEFLAGHVTIEIRATRDEVRKICNWCPEGTFSPEHHPDGGPEHRVASGIQQARMVNALERIAELESQVDSLEIRLETSQQERHQELAESLAQRARADENKEWAERAERLLDESRQLADHNKRWAERAEAESNQYRAKAKDTQNRLDEAEATISGVTTRIGRISGAVQGTAIKSALGRAWSGWNETEAVAVVNAVRDVRSIIGIPLS